MNRLKPVIFVTVLALIGATAALLAHAKSIQKLGQPGVKTRPLANSQNREVLLPDDLSGYKSQWFPLDASVTNGLPEDTSFGQRVYQVSDASQAPIQVNVVLMGSSRRSIHKPQVCLTGQGWIINNSTSREVSIPMDKPVSYDLPVMRLNVSGQMHENGQSVAEAGVFVYWFVDGDRYTAAHATRMLWMARDVALKGELDRWAYVSFWCKCWPGQEDETFDRIKKLITLSVPEFQLVPQVTK